MEPREIAEGLTHLRRRRILHYYPRRDILYPDFIDDELERAGLIRWQMQAGDPCRYYYLTELGIAVREEIIKLTEKGDDEMNTCLNCRSKEVCTLWEEVGDKADELTNAIMDADAKRDEIYGEDLNKLAEAENQLEDFLKKKWDDNSERIKVLAAEMNLCDRHIS